MADEVRIKSAPLRVKEAGPDDGLAEGEFIAYASVFGNVDSYGDIVEDTFFDRTLEEWKSSGDTIPVLWGHDIFDPFNNIGGVKEATVIKAAGEKADGEKPGLKVHGVLDLENPTAAQVYRLMKGRRTTKMSFAYTVTDAEEKDDGYHLKDGDLYEVSIVQIPANQEAEILTVKSAVSALTRKAGRVLSAKNETALREARDAIDAVLNSLGSSDDEDGKAGSPAGTQQKASEQTPANASVPAEEPATANAGASAEEPKSASSVDVWGAEFDIYSTAYAGKD